MLRKGAVHRWQLQDAKARLSRLLRSAKSRHQGIALHSTPAAFAASKAAPQRPRRESSLVRFLRHSPLAGVGLQIQRDRSPTRAGTGNAAEFRFPALDVINPWEKG